MIRLPNDPAARLRLLESFFAAPGGGRTPRFSRIDSTERRLRCGGVAERAGVAMKLKRGERSPQEASRGGAGVVGRG